VLIVIDWPMNKCPLLWKPAGSRVSQCCGCLWISGGKKHTLIESTQIHKQLMFVPQINCTLWSV